jgi:tetratricopeptide (TPR) repeat protein
VVRTFTAVFPHTQLWCVNLGTDFLLLGSDRPLTLPLVRLRERLKQPGIRQALGRVAMDDECEFLAGFLLDDAALRRLAEGAELHTDDRMQLEFGAPKALYRRTETMYGALLSAEPERVLDLTGLAPGERADFLERLDRAVSAREHTRCAMEKLGAAAKHWEAAARLAPGMLWSREYLNNETENRAAELLAGESSRTFPPDSAGALKELVEAQARWEDTSGLAAKVQNARLQHAQYLWSQGRAQETVAELERVVDPALRFPVLLLRARIHIAQGELEVAFERTREAALIGKDEEQIEALDLGGRILWAQGQPDKALGFLDAVRGIAGVRTGPGLAALERLRGEILYEMGRYTEACEAAKAAQEADSRDPRNMRIRAHAERKLGHPAAAAESFRDRALLAPQDFEALRDAAEAELAAAASLRTKEPEAARTCLYRARRLSREMTVLFPSRAAGWELLACSVLRIAEIEVVRSEKATESGQ